MKTSHVTAFMCLVFVFSIGNSTPAQANLYTFTEIAGQSFNGFGFGASINASGTVAFQTFGPRGIWIGNGGQTQKIVDTASGVFSQFDGGLPSINDRGDVAFVAELANLPPVGDGGNVIGRFDTATSILTTIADTTGPFESFSPRVTMNNFGTVAFWGEFDTGDEWIAVGVGGPISFIASAPSTAFEFFRGGPVIARNGSVLEVAFTADAPEGQRGIYRGGSLTPKIPIFTKTGGSVSFPSSPSINDAGEVLFASDKLGGLNAVAIGDGITTTIVADSAGPYERFWYADGPYGGGALSNTGMAFYAKLDLGGGEGVFTGPNPVTDRVLTLGESLLGFPDNSPVEFVRIGPEGLNDNGQLAMALTFTGSNGDTHQVIVRADPLGSLQSVPPGLDAMAAMKSVDEARLRQVIETPIRSSELTFDYLFRTTEGQLVVKLGDEELATILAPHTEGSRLSSFSIQVDVLSILPDPPPPTLLLDFILEGDVDEPAGLLLDNISFDSLINGDFRTGDLSEWESEVSLGGAVGVAISPAFTVPEPSSGALLGWVAIGIAVYFRRPKRPAQ